MTEKRKILLEKVINFWIESNWDKADRLKEGAKEYEALIDENNELKSFADENEIHLSDENKNRW